MSVMSDSDRPTADAAPAATLPEGAASQPGTDGRPSGASPAARFTGVAKSFGNTRALQEIDLEIAPGTIHALIGENGAGKSTALGILAGRIGPSEGTVEVFGEELPYGDPRGCRRTGVVAIYQELTIVPALSPEANVYLAGPLARGGILAQDAMRKGYEELCARIGVPVAPRGVLAGQLSVADQQLLEIARALVAEARILLFDEPTSSLAISEREALLSLMRQLREEGVTIVFVSHNLDEVLEVSDSVTVFRDGRHVRTAPVAEWDKRRMVQTMLGDKADSRVASELLEEAPAAAPRRRKRGDAVVLRATGVTVPDAIEDVEVEIHRGEIFGVGGLVGSGRSTLLRALAGAEPQASGRLWIDGEEVRWPRNVRRSRSYGIALLPEDRKGQGLVLGMSARDNVILSDLGAVSSSGILRRGLAARRAREMAEPVGVDVTRLPEAARNLSGGNQQKLLFARWRHRPPKILLADEPTRGIDIGAKEEIMRVLEGMAEDGLAIVMVSSELEEVVAISDRVLVLAEGRPVGLLDSEHGEIVPSDILKTAFEVEAH
jgi:ABC-type sugar transport system ATPase subunit